MVPSPLRVTSPVRRPTTISHCTTTATDGESLDWGKYLRTRDAYSTTVDIAIRVDILEDPWPLFRTIFAILVEKAEGGARLRLRVQPWGHERMGVIVGPRATAAFYVSWWIPILAFVSDCVGLGVLLQIQMDLDLSSVLRGRWGSLSARQVGSIARRVLRNEARDNATVSYLCQQSAASVLVRCNTTLW